MILPCGAPSGLPLLLVVQKGPRTFLALRYLRPANMTAEPTSAGRLVQDSPWVRSLPILGVVLATMLTYAATLNFGFVFDDHVLIETNDAIRSWRYFPGYFTSHIWSFRYPHLLANYYRPLFLTWLRLNDAVFGLRPWGWHLTLVLVHVGVTWLVYRLALRATEDRRVAVIAALVFGLHPVQAEAVSDVTSAQEPLSTFFILAGLLAWWGSRDLARRTVGLACAVACYAAALLSKESGLMFLPLLLILEGACPAAASAAIPVRQRLRSFLFRASPLLLVTILYLAVRTWALKGFAHIVTPVPLATEVFTIPAVLLFYLRLLVWPVGLSCYYDTPYVSAASLRAFVLPAAVILMAAAALAFWYVKTRRYSPAQARPLAMAALWMAVAIVPVLNFRLLPQGEIAHDRYLYLPCVGFAILAGLAWRVAGARIELWLLRPIATAEWIAVGCLAVLLGSAAARQSLYWSDDLTLNSRAHKIAPHNVYATTSLAAAAAQRGMEAAAVALYQQALAANPDFWRANVNFAYLLYAHGDYADAAAYFRHALTVDPTDGDQFLYLGMSLLHMGRPHEAETAVRQALAVRPNGRDYHLGLGMVLVEEEKLPEARQELEQQLAKDPHNAQAETLLRDVVRRLPPVQP